MRYDKRVFTRENEEDILCLFYRTELERGERIIDNSDKYISNRLKLKQYLVSTFIANHLEYKFNKIYKYTVV
tara:strand:+ start:199 stop:414 length:216 start_codon:yes stop_codon:yes gene_type:complete